MVGPDGLYPIHAAAHNGNAEVIQKLLESHADPNQLVACFAFHSQLFLISINFFPSPRLSIVV